jgi:hypothetical protein
VYKLKPFWKNSIKNICFDTKGGQQFDATFYIIQGALDNFGRCFSKFF